ncbi:MAG: hypothetical protein QOH04_3040 [Sphingomonadales bacterium]|jgi:hypothetical protein|nr:hypothetical protein [Sphingomonadales bacterium]
MKIHILAATAAAFIAFAPAGAQGTGGGAAGANGATSNAAGANTAAPDTNAAASDMMVPAAPVASNAAPPEAVDNGGAVDTSYGRPPPVRPHGFPWGVLGLIGLVGLLPLFRRGGDR